MGFRSTFTTEDTDVAWPDWFVKKYRDSVYFGPKNRGTIAARFEDKTYAWGENPTFSELPEDARKAIDWDDYGLPRFVMVFLHECGGITRIQIERDRVRYSEPASWDEVEGVTHSYCDGCSDLKIEKPSPRPPEPVAIVLMGGPKAGQEGEIQKPLENFWFRDGDKMHRYLDTYQVREDGRRIFAYAPKGEYEHADDYDTGSRTANKDVYKDNKRSQPD